MTLFYKVQRNQTGARTLNVVAAEKLKSEVPEIASASHTKPTKVTIKTLIF